MTNDERRKVKKVPELLRLHKDTIINELGPRAYELLTPSQVRSELDIDSGKKAALPDLIRQEWLEPAHGYDAGPAHLYYRWRVEFIKRFKGKHEKPKKSA